MTRSPDRLDGAELGREDRAHSGKLRLNVPAASPPVTACGTRPNLLPIFSPRPQSLSPNISRIVLHVVLLQKSNELILETTLAMVSRLRLDIRNRGRRLRDTNRKCPISLLPREIPGMRFVHPSRRCTFDQLHRLRQRHIRRQRQQDVHVIFGAANFERLEFVFARYRREKTRGPIEIPP